MKPITLVHKYGAMVMQSAAMEKLRKTECMCLHCYKMPTCDTAQSLYYVCQQKNLALMVTRCPVYSAKEAADNVQV